MSGERSYKVYAHINKIDGKRYIGQTKEHLSSRSGHNGKNYRQCTYFWKAIQKHGWSSFDHVILFDRLTSEEANAKEKEMIAFYQTTNPECGYNIQAGGQNGTHGMSPEGRNAISKRFSGANHPSAKGIAVFDLTGKRIATLGTEREAGKYLGICSANISKICKQKSGTLGRHLCFYQEDVGDIDQLPDHLVIKPYENCGIGKTINQYDMDGHYLRTFESTTEAAKNIGLTSANLGASARGDKHHQLIGGFQWRYDTGDHSDINPCLPGYIRISGENNCNVRPIYRVALDGTTILGTYPTRKEAARKTGISIHTIDSALRRGSKSHGSFWRLSDAQLAFFL